MDIGPLVVEHSGDSNERPFKFENYTQRTILACLFLFISVVGTFGNSLTILAVILSRKLRTSTNVFVINLSVADLFTCLSLPWNAVALLSKNGFPLPEEICATAAFVLFTCGGCSLYTLAAIALNRWLLITRGARFYRTHFKPVNMAVMVAITWMVPLTISLIPPVFKLGDLGYSEKYSTCSHNTSHPFSDYYSILQGAVFYPVPLIIIIVCYYKVYKYVTIHAKAIVDQTDISTTSNQNNGQQHQAKGATSISPHISQQNNNTRTRITKRQVEITKNLFYVVIAFVVCMSPFAVSLMIPPSDPVIPWTSALLLFNSAVNPVIYATKHPYFKQMFKLMLTCNCRKIPEPSSVLRSINNMSKF